MKYIFYLITTLLLFACNDKNFEKIKFENHYKFRSEIEKELIEQTPHPLEDSLLIESNSGDIPHWKYQISAQDYSIKGDHKKALQSWDLAFSGVIDNYTGSQKDSINSKYKKIPAANYIIEKSKAYQVIIINEAHHNSFHRSFTKSLLKELYDIGYKNLLIEALKNDKELDSLLNTRKFPIQKTGYYIRDPQFGDLVRKALKIGFNLSAYDNMDVGPGNPREIQQAKNIQKIIEKRPNEKFLIYCGFDHALEGIHGSWGKAMAGRLSEFTGIDPLTINQVAYSEKSKAAYSHPLLKVLELKNSSVLVDEKNNPYKYERGGGWNDIAIFHPRTEYLNSRPTWLLKNNIQNIKIELKDIDISFPVMILAFIKGEDINNAIPFDIVEVEEQNNKANLALERGEYEVVVTNQKGNSRKMNLRVD
jgi:hypothetical protein